MTVRVTGAARGPAWYGGPAWLRVVRRGTAPRVALRGSAWYGAPRGSAWPCVAPRGTAWYGVVRRSAWYGAVRRPARPRVVQRTGYTARYGPVLPRRESAAVKRMRPAF
ncbi:hypothetical protein TPA0910_46960 [Streptomyces hygroscopicus subsp. sporocinereus]|uniref:Uncharacterized protein n=1 Tax=Streptomyces hygroscopicus TaxID=1912 RepID=A0ABQ3U4Z5_STRHY|nr:hypothetical protein TPA0910_46960 [Streptomyces hygroscopicus]